MYIHSQQADDTRNKTRHVCASTCTHTDTHDCDTHRNTQHCHSSQVRTDAPYKLPCSNTAGCSTTTHTYTHNRQRAVQNCEPLGWLCSQPRKRLKRGPQSTASAAAGMRRSVQLGAHTYNTSLKLCLWLQQCSPWIHTPQVGRRHQQFPPLCRKVSLHSHTSQQRQHPPQINTPIAATCTQQHPVCLSPGLHPLPPAPN